MQHTKEDQHFLNYWEARNHEISFEKFMQQSHDFLKDMKDLRLDFIKQMKRLYPACRKNVERVHHYRHLKKGLSIKEEIINLQDLIIEAQSKIQDLKNTLETNHHQYKKEKEQLKERFKKIKDF